MAQGLLEHFRHHSTTLCYNSTIQDSFNKYGMELKSTKLSSFTIKCSNTK